MEILREIKRRKKFYEDVKFRDDNTQKHLKKQLLNYAKEHNFETFKSIIEFANESMDIVYPIEIMGISLKNIMVIDTKSREMYFELLDKEVTIYSFSSKNTRYYNKKFDS